MSTADLHVSIHLTRGLLLRFRGRLLLKPPTV